MRISPGSRSSGDVCWLRSQLRGQNVKFFWGPIHQRVNGQGVLELTVRAQRCLVWEFLFVAPCVSCAGVPYSPAASSRRRCFTWPLMGWIMEWRKSGAREWGDAPSRASNSTGHFNPLTSDAPIAQDYRGLQGEGGAELALNPQWPVGGPVHVLT